MPGGAAEDGRVRRSSTASASRSITYRLKDWGISRQRYWGTPIPMIYCAKDGLVPVPEDQLPVLLPEKIEITQEGGSPLARVPEFVHVDLPEVRRDRAARDRHHGHVRRFVLVFLPLHRSEKFARAVRQRTVAYWFPIDQYIGGVEHAILHLIYSRFWTKMMRDMGLVKNDEPVGAALHPGHGHPQWREDVEVEGQRGLARRHDRPLRRRCHPHVRAFAAPPDRDLDWQEDGVAGVSRFLARVYRFATQAMPRGDRRPRAGSCRRADVRSKQRLLRKLHQTIRRMTQEFDGRWHFNTCIAAIMELVNDSDSGGKRHRAGSGPQSGPLRHHARSGSDAAGLRALSCSRAVVADWARRLRCCAYPGPRTMKAWLRKMRSRFRCRSMENCARLISVPVAISEEDLRARVWEDAKVQAAIAGKEVVKVIVVPGKLVNLVVKAVTSTAPTDAA